MTTVAERMKDLIRFIEKYDSEDSNTLRWMLRDLADTLEKKDCDRDVNCLSRFVTLGAAAWMPGRLCFVMEPKSTNRRNASMAANRGKNIWTLQ